MKMRLMSDLHLEFSKHEFDHLWAPSEEDKETVLLLAGDIDTGTNSVEFITETCKSFKYVLRVFGNHEHYSGAWDDNIDFWKAYQSITPNFYFMDNEVVVLDGTRFIGGTMWTSFDSYNPIKMNMARMRMNDYNYIIPTKGDYPVTPDFIAEEHRKFITFFVEEMAKPFDGQTVVMTHHSPGNDKLRSGYRYDTDFCYFADIEELVGSTDVKLWVHGHTHKNADYVINDTRVVCNPFGYHNYEQNPTYIQNLILEV